MNFTLPMCYLSSFKRTCPEKLFTGTSTCVYEQKICDIREPSPDTNAMPVENNPPKGTTLDSVFYRCGGGTFKNIGKVRVFFTVSTIVYGETDGDGEEGASIVEGRRTPRGSGKSFGGCRQIIRIETLIRPRLSPFVKFCAFDLSTLSSHHSNQQAKFFIRRKKNRKTEQNPHRFSPQQFLLPHPFPPSVS